MDSGLDVATGPKYKFCGVKHVSYALLLCWDPTHNPRRVTNVSKGSTWVRCAQTREAWWAPTAAIAGLKKPMKRDGMKVKGPAPWVGEGEWLNADARVAQELKFERCEANVAATS